MDGGKKDQMAERKENTKKTKHTNPGYILCVANNECHTAQQPLPCLIAQNKNYVDDDDLGTSKGGGN